MRDEHKISLRKGSIGRGANADVADFQAITAQRAISITSSRQRGGEY